MTHRDITAGGALVALLVILAVISGAADRPPTFEEQRTHVAFVAPLTHPTPPAAPTAGEPTDDTPGFDCRRHGNGVCGPDNPGGYAAGCYVRTGKRAGTLLTRWDERMRQELFTGAYRPTRCGRLTVHDRAMARRLDGSVGQLCANNAHGGVTCWWADQPRPHDADGAPWDPTAGAR